MVQIVLLVEEHYRLQQMVVEEVLVDLGVHLLQMVSMVAAVGAEVDFHLALV
jgi:hypothetical protein